MTLGPVQTPLGSRRACRDLRRTQQAPGPGFAAVFTCLLGGVILAGLCTGQAIRP